MSTYTYTIFDGDPASSGDCKWPSHNNLEIEADTAPEALAAIIQIAQDAASSCGEYSADDRLWTIVWDEYGVIAAKGSFLAICD